MILDEILNVLYVSCLHNNQKRNAMEKHLIKGVVEKVNLITTMNDKNFSTKEAQQIGGSLLSDLVLHFQSSPNTAIALTQYLFDRHFDLSKADEKIYQQFINAFKRHIIKCSSRQIEQLRKISERLVLN